MSSSSISTRRGIGTRAKMLILGAMVACVGLFALNGAQAKAADFGTTLDNGQLNLGAAFKNKTILPAPATLGANPLPNLCGAVPPGNLPHILVDGDLTGNAVTVAQADFCAPIMQVPNPLDGTPVPITLRAMQDLSGTFDSATGAMTLQGVNAANPSFEARVLVGLGKTPPNPGNYCAVPLTGLKLSTDGNSDFGSSPFTAGIEGAGALSGKFQVTADSIPTGGALPADCATVNVVTKGSGSLWLSHDITTPAPGVKCPTGTTGTYPNCVPDPVECPAGEVGTPPNCEKPKTPFSVGSITVTPKKKTVKKGKSLKLTIKVKNSGETDGTVKVALKSSNKKVTLPKSVSVKVGAGKTVSKKVTVKVNKKAKGKANITAKGGGKTGKATITVKK